MTVITVTTVGLGEVRKLEAPGQVFTIVLIVCGVGTWAYAVGTFSRLLIEGEIRGFITRKRLKRMLTSITNHTILCGYGRIGRIVAQELAQAGTSIVVIERSPAAAQELERAGYLYMIGDATQEDVLRTAGIEKARCLISALGTDASNVYTVLIARDLNPRLYIVGRSEDETAEDKILRAGADKVISPYLIGAHSLVQAAVRPHVLNFIEVATSTRSVELSIEEIAVPDRSPLVGETLMGAKVRERFGIIVVGSRTREDNMIFNPPADYPIRAGEVLIAMGKRENLNELRRAVTGAAASA
jgi:voltage-gated potassium channel